MQRITNVSHIGVHEKTNNINRLNLFTKMNALQSVILMRAIKSTLSLSTLLSS